MKYLLFFLIFLMNDLVGQPNYSEITQIEVAIINQLEGKLLTKTRKKPSIDPSLEYELKTTWDIGTQKVNLLINRFDSSINSKKYIEENVVRRLMIGPKIYQIQPEQTYYLFKNEGKESLLDIHHGAFYLRLSTKDLNLLFSVAEVVLQCLPPFYPSFRVPFLKNEFSIGQQLFFNSMQQDTLINKISWQQRLDTLSKLALDTLNTNAIRLAAIKCLANIPLVEANRFLLNNIDLTLSSKFYPDHFYMDLQPCFELLIKNKKLDLDKDALIFGFLSKNLGREKLKYIYRLLINHPKGADWIRRSILTLRKTSLFFLGGNLSWLITEYNRENTPKVKLFQSPPPPPPKPGEIEIFDFKVLLPPFSGICEDASDKDAKIACLKKAIEKEVRVYINPNIYLNSLNRQDSVNVKYWLAQDGTISGAKIIQTNNNRLTLSVLNAFHMVELPIKWNKNSARKKHFKIIIEQLFVF